MSTSEALSGSAPSVRGRLRELARRRGLEFQLVLSEFAIERLLYRLGASSHRDRFVVKGATLFRLWPVGERRATWDLDLLGCGSSGVDDVIAVVRELCEMPADDAIEFDGASVRGEEIRSPDEYGGVRVRFVAQLVGAEIPVQIDVGFGDAVEPAPRIEPFPTLLGHPTPRVLVYPRETVVAEKLEAIISLGVTTSRMKNSTTCTTSPRRSSLTERCSSVRYARPSLDVELRCPWRNPSRSLDRSFPHQSGCASGARSSAEAVSKRPLVVRRFRMSCDASYFPSSRLRGGPATSRRIGQPVVRGRDGDDGPEANYRCRLWCHSSPRTPRRQR